MKIRIFENSSITIKNGVLTISPVDDQQFDEIREFCDDYGIPWDAVKEDEETAN